MNFIVEDDKSIPTMSVRFIDAQLQQLVKNDDGTRYWVAVPSWQWGPRL